MNRTLVVLHWLSRYLLGVVFIYSGYVKTQATLQFAAAIAGYKIIPDTLAYPIAQYLPWLEIVLGVIILSGLEIRWSSMVAAGLMLFFIVLLSITLIRGIDTNCGCFGFGDRITWKTIVRDGSFLIPALLLVFESRRQKRVRWTNRPA
jgi:putative oxidoreductase